MITVNWTTLMLGGGVGTVVGALFFVGLAYGMRLALRSAAPVKLLALSAALRIISLLGVGWVVVTQGGPWAALGYAGAFFVTRIIATTLARITAPVGRT